MTPPPPFAAALDVAGRVVLVGAAGPSAIGTIRALLDAGALVRAHGAAPATTVADLAARGLIDLTPAEPTEADIAAADLVVLAGDSLRQRARALGRLVAGVPDVPPPDDVIPAGSVVLVGGGPGDPGLLTLAGLAAIRSAEVIVCDRLAPLGVLQQARPDAEIIDVAKIPRGEYTAQETINTVLIERARAGRRVVRFKGGDNFVFGRGGEEWLACAEAGVPVRVVPGLSSAIAAPALAGVPLTHRDLTQGFTVVSGHLAPNDPRSMLDWEALSRANTTLVIMMGLATLPAITTTLVAHGLAADTPALTVADAGLPSQVIVRARVADIGEATRAAGLKPPAITVIGAVAALELLAK